MQAAVSVAFSHPSGIYLSILPCLKSLMMLDLRLTRGIWKYFSMCTSDIVSVFPSCSFLTSEHQCLQSLICISKSTIAKTSEWFGPSFNLLEEIVAICSFDSRLNVIRCCLLVWIWVTRIAPTYFNDFCIIILDRFLPLRKKDGQLNRRLLVGRRSSFSHYLRK